MKKLANFISYIMSFVFMLALCTIESATLVSICAILVSGTWLAVQGYIYEQRRLKAGR